MSFVKLNLVLKTDGPTDRPTDRQTDGPTNLSIEATCRRLKIIESFKTNLLVFQKKSLKCFCSVIKLRLKSLQINERSLKLCINSEVVIIQPIETLILGVSIIGTVRQTCRYEVRP